MGNQLRDSVSGRDREGVCLNHGEHVEIATYHGDVAIRRAVPRFTLKELFQGKSPKKWRAAYARAFDLGPDVGHENVED